MSVDVELQDIVHARVVDRYVGRHPSGTPFHETRWLALVRDIFGFEPHTLVARRAGELVGVLPMALVTAPITGRRLVSVPFGVYGGILASDEEAAVVLDDAGCRLARQLGARFLEQRYRDPPMVRHVAASVHETYRCELPESADAVLGTIPRKARAEVRKARNRHGAVLHEGRHLLGDFYRLYVLNKRGLGSPVFRASYFKQLMDLFGARALLHAIVCEGQVLSAVLSIVSRGEIYPYYSGTEPGAERKGVNNAMYAGLMEDAVRRGCHVFDFGRSRIGSGPARFKRNMGFEAAPLHYQFFFPRGGKPPALNPDNPHTALPRRILSRLPSWAAQLVGPSLMRHVP